MIHSEHYLNLLDFKWACVEADPKHSLKNTPLHHLCLDLFMQVGWLEYMRLDQIAHDNNL